MKVTNTQKGARGINTKHGTILIEPGQTVVVEMHDDKKQADAEIKIARASGWFEFGAADKTKAEGGKADQAKAVLAMAYDEKVHFKTFEAEAKKVLGEKTPDKKDDIVKALEEVATQPQA